jgi:surface carbohydrate biosynthesis protein (TIGR04326 family)
VKSVGLIWDLPAAPPAWEGQVFHWRSTEAPPGGISIPAYLELHGDRLRQAYLSFVHALGALPVVGLPVRQHLQDGAGNNFWWMGLLAEKSPFKTPEIYQALRLLALEDCLRATPPGAVELRTADRTLARAVRALCAQYQIAFSHVSQADQEPRKPLRMVLRQYVPGCLQGLAAVCAHLVRRWPLRHLRPLRWNAGEEALLVCSYFAHLDGTAAKAGAFYSRQWGPLPRLLADSGLRVNWLQNFWPGDVAPDARAGVALARRFNGAASGLGQHGFVDSYLGVRVLLRALGSWWFLLSRAWALRGMAPRLQEHHMPAFLWPVLRAAWASSLVGRVGFANCLNVHLFDAALSDIPPQPRGLYLFESQAWEKAFLTAWRRHGHGHITGVVHATVPFWHLYYAEDLRSLQEAGADRMPMPDQVAVHGEGARDALLTQGYGASQLVEVEALRYLGLARVEAAPAAGGTQEPWVLIVGDMEPDGLRDLLQAVRKAKELLPAGYRFAFKPHPAYLVDPMQMAGVDIPVVGGNLAELLQRYDCVIAGNSTSACVDAFLAGKPVIIAHSGQYLNLSPLRGQPGAVFFESAQQLVAALGACNGNKRRAPGGNAYFYLNGDLARWRRLLGLSRVAAATGATNGNGIDEFVSE